MYALGRSDPLPKVNSLARPHGYHDRTVLELLDLREFTGDLAEPLAAPEEPPGPIDQVRAILADVRNRGDTAVRELTARFDGCTLDKLAVPAAALDEARDGIPSKLRAALEDLAAAVRAYHEAQFHAPVTLDRDGLQTRELVIPVRRAGCYVPGGRAVYPSTVLMTAVPARVAGVAEVVLCAPPSPDGTVPTPTLAAAAVAGVDTVYRIGGAQAIGALAYGTESIRPVDVIVGPGNVYVALAKREVAGRVGTDSVAGPSEVVVVADEHADPELVAADLLAQAEHGPGGEAVLVTWHPALVDAVDAALTRRLPAAPRRAEIEASLGAGGRAVLVRDAGAGDRRRERARPRAPRAVHRRSRHAGAAGPQRGRRVLRVVDPSRRRRLRGGGQPRAAHRPHGPLRERAAGRRLPEAGPRGARRRGRAPPARARHRGPRRRGGAPRARPVGGAARPPEPGRRRRGVPVTLPTPRDDLGTLERYHSPQLDVSVRLNTNESPFPPPPGFVDAWLDAVRAVPLHRYPDREARRLRGALAERLDQPPARVFAANGSNEVLQTLLLAYGGAGRRAVVFEPTYALHSHLARISGATVVAGERGDNFLVSPTEAEQLLDRRAAVDRVPLQPQQPDRPGRAPRHRRGAAGLGRRAPHCAPGRRRGLRRVRGFGAWSSRRR